jgi:hypothetical protein
MNSKNGVRIYRMECKDFGMCFTIFLLSLYYSSRPVHLLASSPFHLCMCVNPGVPTPGLLLSLVNFFLPIVQGQVDPEPCYSISLFAGRNCSRTPLQSHHLVTFFAPPTVASSSLKFRHPFTLSYSLVLISL